MAFHNLLTEPAWFFPAFAIARRLSAPQNFIASYIGAEIRNGQAVQHISLSQPPPFTEPPGGLSLTRLSQIDIFLDSNTFLPAAATLNIHPDNNALLDIPIEIRFSDYRSVNGGQIPFHVERVLNNGLILDLEFQTATLNSGLSPTEFR
jgi:hypothetical protein